MKVRRPTAYKQTIMHDESRDFLKIWNSFIEKKDTLEDARFLVLELVQSEN
jgi:hypothetical protein